MVLLELTEQLGYENFITPIDSQFLISSIIQQAFRMDPLSVTASIVGLLLAAGQVSSAIYTIKSNLSEAPRMVDNLLGQVAQIKTCLSAIQDLLYGMNMVSRQRMALIKVDHLVASLTQAVLTFSELEALINKIITGPSSSLMLRVNWTRRQNKLASIMQRLESHKSSLSLMLSIARWSVSCFYFLMQLHSYYSLG
jgi:hypothetical protein